MNPTASAAPVIDAPTCVTLVDTMCSTPGPPGMSTVNTTRFVPSLRVTRAM